MNSKQSLIDSIMDIVVDCCKVEVDGKVLVTKEDVISKKRDDNVLMARCIFVTEMIFAGYSRATIAAYLHRDIKTIGNILNQAHQYRVLSKAYRKAEAEATLATKDLE